LASAAVAAGSGSAEATIVYHATPGLTAPGSLALPGGNSIALNLTRSRWGTTDSVYVGNRRGAFSSRNTLVKASARGAAFRAVGSQLALAKKGQTFNKVGTRIVGEPTIGTRLHQSEFSAGTAWFPYPKGRSVFRVLSGYPFSNWVENKLGSFYGTRSGQSYTFIRFSAYSRTTRLDFPNYNDKYALFRFDVGGQADYGWLELSVGGGLYPGVNVLGYAYQTNGKPIKAGDVPEPQRLPVALGALALGAIGVKEWRKKRNAVA
jgi:hypothetical protein